MAKRDREDARAALKLLESRSIVRDSHAASASKSAREDARAAEKVLEANRIIGKRSRSRKGCVYRIKSSGAGGSRVIKTAATFKAGAAQLKTLANRNRRPGTQFSLLQHCKGKNGKSYNRLMAHCQYDTDAGKLVCTKTTGRNKVTTYGVRKRKAHKTCGCTKR